MTLLIGCILGFLLAAGFGMATNVYMDIFRVKKKTNDTLALIGGLLMVGLIIYVSR
ncbi:MAG: hypothetical protein WCL00_00140 [Bacteroidota bacterium]